MIACDTGFFVEYLNATQQAADVWAQARSVGQKPIMSVISVYELRKLAFKGEIEQTRTAAFLNLVPRLCHVVYLGEALSHTLLEQAARIAHGNGMSMADSLIFTSALQAGATVLYTSDGDMAKYKGKLGPKIVLL